MKSGWQRAVGTLFWLGLVACLGCEVGPRSGRGLRLPDGDLERGATAFRELGCETCHDVVGMAVPEGIARAETIVKLGGEVTRVETYGELVTSIIHPSHDVQRRYRVEDGKESPMPAVNERMTVAQLVDLTAFLQSTYERRREPLYIP